MPRSSGATPQSRVTRDAITLAELAGTARETYGDGPGTGTESFVWLPAAASDEATAATTPREIERADVARVLLIEDNRDAAESLAALLEVFGYAVRVACDGPTALALAERVAPDVMLIDIGLPGMDGYAVARRVRADARFAGVTLMALTGYGHAEDRRAALDAGFDCHLVKPVEPTVLEEVLAQHVAGRTRAADSA